MSATAEKLPEPELIRMTADEFLVSKIRLGPGKHELVHGVLVAMAPASPTHGQIQAKLAHLLTAHFLKNKMPCRVMTEAGYKPRVRGKTNVRIPDLIVACGPPPGPQDRLIADPLIVIEVLSPSNNYDPDSGIFAGATLPSVSEILVVDSIRQSAEFWRRDDAGAWPAEPDTIVAGGHITLASINCTLALADIYAGTHLSDT